MNGLYLIKPTSIVSTGTGNSSSINTNGSVTFSTCATLSLNGVFSADYDNYMIVMRHVSNLGGNYIMYLRMRASGTDNSTASSYVQQQLGANAGTVSGSRTTSNQARILISDSNARSGTTMWFYGPYLSQPTAVRSISVGGYLSANFEDDAVTHNQSVAYDGFTLIQESASATYSGLLGVYGMVK